MMTALQWALLTTVVALVSSGQAQEAGDALRCIQKPVAWMVGQQTRIVIETPIDCPERGR